MNLVKKFFKFTIPSIVSMWIFSLYSMVDGIFVSWGVGEHALTAVNLSLPFVSLIFTLGILLATGTSTILSIALGQGDVEKARNYFNQNLFVVIVTTVILSVIVLLNLDWVEHFLGSAQENDQLEKEYVGVIAAFSVFFTVSYNLEVQVKADGAPHVSIIGVTSCGLMNVLLDYIFVMHFHWGVWGAALATGLSQATSTLVFVVYFLTHRYPLRFGKFKPDFGAYRRIIPLGTADGLSELSNGFVMFLFNHIIQRVIGLDALVSYTIIGYVNTLVINCMIGIAHGIQPLSSFHLGAGERHMCHKFLAFGVRTAAVFAVIFFAGCQLLAAPIVGMFLEHDSALFASSVSALRLYSFAFLLVGFNVVVSGFFTAMEHPFPSLTISFGRGLVLIAGCLLVLSSLFGATGIWLSPLASEAICLVSTVFFLVRYFRRVRQEDVVKVSGFSQPSSRPYLGSGHG